MKILHLLDATTPDYAIEMLGALIAFNPTEHVVLSLGHRSIGQAVGAAGVPAERVRYLRSMGWADPLAIRNFRRLLGQLNPTHLHAWGDAGLMAAAACAFSGPRMATPAGVPSALVRRALRALGATFTWTATSLATLEALRQAGLGLPAQPSIFLLTPGVHAPLAASADRAQLRKALGLAATDSPVILLGGSGPSARHDHALWAAGILQQIYPQAKALVRADPTLTYDHARAFARVLPADDMVVFAPSETPWPLLVQAADLFLFTPDASLPTTSLLWAMAGRLPIIASDVPSMREFLTDHQTALLAPPAKPRVFAGRLEELLRTPALQASLAQNAYTLVTERFTRQAMQQSFLSLYQSAPTLAIGSSHLSVSSS